MTFVKVAVGPLFPHFSYSGCFVCQLEDKKAQFGMTVRRLENKSKAPRFHALEFPEAIMIARKAVLSSVIDPNASESDSEPSASETRRRGSRSKIFSYFLHHLLLRSQCLPPKPHLSQSWNRPPEMALTRLRGDKASQTRTKSWCNEEKPQDTRVGVMSATNSDQRNLWCSWKTQRTSNCSNSKLTTGDDAGGFR